MRTVTPLRRRVSLIGRHVVLLLVSLATVVSTICLFIDRSPTGWGWIAVVYCFGIALPDLLEWAQETARWQEVSE